MDKEKLDAIVDDVLETQREELKKLSLKIHANPELGFEEVKASGWLTEYLRGNGYIVEQGICELDTAFRASYGQGQPVIAVIAEYDALPGLGHACGHNIIAVSAVGTAVAVKAAIDRYGGTMLVIGTPAEEGGGGKIIMAKRGAFNDVDMAMMVHPGAYNSSTIKALACQTLEVEFVGKAAHAAAQPDAGINALEAMLNSFNAINSLRQHIKDRARIHGIITDGGEAANIVPAHSAASFKVRAEDDNYLEEIKQKVLNCFVGAATGTGARLEYRWANIRYATMRNNQIMAQLFGNNINSLGRNVQSCDPKATFGSTDMGNVSHLIPSIHAIIAIASIEVANHSTEFAEAAASDAGLKGLTDAAKAMAMTVGDLLANPKTVTEVKKEFSLGK
jgi:amidohydrolase